MYFLNTILMLRHKLFWSLLSKCLTHIYKAKKAACVICVMLLPLLCENHLVQVSRGKHWFFGILSQMFILLYFKPFLSKNINNQSSRSRCKDVVTTCIPTYIACAYQKFRVLFLSNFHPIYSMYSYSTLRLFVFKSQRLLQK